MDLVVLATFGCSVEHKSSWQPASADQGVSLWGAATLVAKSSRLIAGHHPIQESRRNRASPASAGDALHHKTHVFASAGAICTGVATSRLICSLISPSPKTKVVFV